MAAVLMVFVTASGWAANDDAVYELAFLPGKDAAKDPRYVSTEDSPCGKVVVARVHALPLVLPGAALIPELIVELNSSGRAIRRWPVPVDASPLGLNGEGLLVESGPLKFWVTPQGAISPYKSGLAIRESEPAACGRSHEFGKSGYVQCRKYRDVVSGEYRVLSFEAPCT
jgi:hypothetical protein